MGLRVRQGRFSFGIVILRRSGSNRHIVRLSRVFYVELHALTLLYANTST